MRRWLSAVVIGTVMAGLTPGPAVVAQTKAKASVPPPGSFDKLSLGNQKVAAALYEAQNPGTLAIGATLKPLTLNQIAAKRQAGQEWGPIFRDMKAQGLVHEKTLRHVVTRYGQFTGLERTVNAKGSSNGRHSALGVGANAHVDGGTRGYGDGGN